MVIRKKYGWAQCHETFYVRNLQMFIMHNELERLYLVGISSLVMFVIKARRVHLQVLHLGRLGALVLNITLD
jgi:hypothetical protein